MKEVYQEELNDLKVKLKSYKYEISKTKKVKSGERRRNKDVRLINNEVACRLDDENMEIEEQIKEVCQFISS